MVKYFVDYPSVKIISCFSHDYTEAIGLGKETTEVKNSFHIHSTYWEHDITVNADLDHLVRFVRFLHCKVTDPHSPFHTVFLGKMQSPYLENE